MVRVTFEKLSLDLLLSIGSEEIIIQRDNEDFYFKVDIKNVSSDLVVHINGALDYSKNHPPVYQRYTWAKDIKANCIFIDDKTLHNVNDEKFNTGWLIGTNEREYIRDYSAIVRKIQNLLGVVDKRVFYWGSSAGGTAAIALSTIHRGTTAIANNPQTNILNDYPRRRDAIFRNVFHDINEDEVIDKQYHRLSLVGLMVYEDYVPRIFYIQNNSHKHDLIRHMTPFIKEIENNKLNIDRKITYWLYHDLEKGHSPLKKEASLEYLSCIMSFKYL